MDDLDRRRRLAAKRSNERFKLLATFFNGAGIASVIVIVIAPTFQGGVSINPDRVLNGLMISIIFHVLGQVALSGLRSED